MDNHTLEVLEYHRIRALLAERARSPFGREAALELLPFTEGWVVAQELDRVSEMKELVAGGAEVVQGEVVDIRPVLSRCGVEGIRLGPKELYRVAEFLEAISHAQEAVLSRGERFPSLLPIVESIHIPTEWVEQVFATIDPDGELVDDASPELLRIRRERSQTRDKLIERLQSILTSRSQAVQDQIITIREGRYVIPVKTAERGRIRGVVHDVSQSGDTLFLEPLASVDLNNRYRQLAIEEREEIQRILAALTSSLRDHLDAVWVSIEQFTQIDLIRAKAVLSIDLDCNAPHLNPSGQVRLSGARHPLLMITRPFDEVVPLDLDLGYEYTTLLVSGPNMGGKTVALKTLGLLALMVQSGMHIPCRPDAEIPVFRSIYADIGDQQSIERNVSTFSSHLRNLIRILEESETGSLVLIDELGVGTDPEQGAALGRVMLEELTEREALVVVTSHYGALKVLAGVEPGMQNAAMEYDHETGRPTYRLQLGTAGGSNAFTTAEQLGMDPHVVERARSYMDQQHLRVEELGQHLEESLGRAETTRTALEQKERRLDGLIDEYRSRMVEIDRIRRKAAEHARREAEHLVRETRARMENLVRAIRESQADREVVRETKRAVEHELAELEATTPSPIPGSDQFDVEDMVLIEPLGKVGRLVELDERNARVEVGGVSFRVPRSSLRRSDDEPSESTPISVRLSGIHDISPELDLRGQTRDEARERLNRYLDDAHLSGLPSVRIIHGKGTGVLRELVDQVLHEDPRVKSYSLAPWNLGGAGATEVEMA
jgi:DNA mismatch repair protein MutS2